MTSAIDHSNYPDAYLKQILTEVKTIALVGASPREDRDSYRCMQVLLEQGYKVYPVNPREAGNQILGQHCYADLASLKVALDQPIHMVDIFRSSDAALAVTEEAIAIGATVVWMQLEIVNDRAAQLAEAAGIKVVMNRCPKIELEQPYWTGIPV